MWYLKKPNLLKQRISAGYQGSEGIGQVLFPEFERRFFFLINRQSERK